LNPNSAARIMNINSTHSPTPFVSGEFAFFLHLIRPKNTKGACPQAAPFSLEILSILLFYQF
jgi:hypothetical protein